MEHITVTEMGNGFFRLIPDEGYRIREKSKPEVTYSDVVTKTPDKFEAVAIDNM